MPGRGQVGANVRDLAADHAVVRPDVHDDQIGQLLGESVPERDAAEVVLAGLQELVRAVGDDVEVLDVPRGIDLRPGGEAPRGIEFDHVQVGPRFLAIPRQGEGPFLVRVGRRQADALVPILRVLVLVAPQLDRHPLQRRVHRFRLALVDVAAEGVGRPVVRDLQLGHHLHMVAALEPAFVGRFARRAQEQQALVRRGIVHPMLDVRGDGPGLVGAGGGVDIGVDPDFRVGGGGVPGDGRFVPGAGEEESRDGDGVGTRGACKKQAQRGGVDDGVIGQRGRIEADEDGGLPVLADDLGGRIGDLQVVLGAEGRVRLVAAHGGIGDRVQGDGRLPPSERVLRYVDVFGRCGVDRRAQGGSQRSDQQNRGTGFFQPHLCLLGRLCLVGHPTGGWCDWVATRTSSGPIPRAAVACVGRRADTAAHDRSRWNTYRARVPRHAGVHDAGASLAPTRTPGVRSLLVPWNRGSAEREWNGGRTAPIISQIAQLYQPTLDQTTQDHQGELHCHLEAVSKRIGVRPRPRG